MTSSADLAVKAKEDDNFELTDDHYSQSVALDHSNFSGNQRQAIEWDKLDAQFKIESLSINESPKPAEGEMYYNPSGLGRGGGFRSRRRVLRFLPGGGYGVRARVNNLPMGPNNSRLNCVFKNRLGWLGFYVGIIVFLASITSAVEHYSDKFIDTHWLKIQVASILAICGFLSLLGYLTLLATELGDYAKKLRNFLWLKGDYAKNIRTFLGLIGIYLSYAGLVIWGDGVFAHNSKVLQIILCSLLLGLPIIGIMEYYRIKKNEFEFTSEEKQILKDIEPTMKSLENIILRYEDYQPLGEADQEFVACVFEHHPRKVEKLGGSQIKHFTVACHSIVKEFGSFYLVLKNGDTSEFSYHTCVRSYVQSRYPKEAESFWKKYTENQYVSSLREGF